ncbi:hypothetical protein PBT90_17575 [Algoriphagus halophytocola]|uniref:LPXTG cell wall anchor domain-containing protein n=1 Tax=Algoriphagus halophytocola TaxID=2991499 RepID=A0ABY6MCC8_9BACT|nr:MULTISPECIES: hypothetical protein [unclassified Algoriphagus]UZD21332.1 hypothetical protein OM944_11710 [Algoriphagus sp. TR-M5]WBL42543.1 hypothetical protein PBT90_17575 [Algoriphagus sp. TR-M9]
MSKDLKKKEVELQETFARQLELVKAESADWVKVGGIALAGGLIAFAIIQSRKKRKNRSTEKAMEVLAREGLLSEEIERKLTQESKSSIWPSLRQRLLILGLALAKEKFLPNLFNPETEDAQVEESDK